MREHEYERAQSLHKAQMAAPLAVVAPDQSAAMGPSMAALGQAAELTGASAPSLSSQAQAGVPKAAQVAQGQAVHEGSPSQAQANEGTQQASAGTSQADAGSPQTSAGATQAGANPTPSAGATAAIQVGDGGHAGASPTAGGDSGAASSPSGSGADGAPPAAPQLDASSLDSLADGLVGLTISALPAGLAQAQAGTATAVEAEKQQAQGQIPELVAPTGMPAAQSAEPAAPTAQVAQAAPSDGLAMAPVTPEVATPDAPVPEAPAAPQPATQIAGTDAKPASGEGDSKPKDDPQMVRSAQSALAGVHSPMAQVPAQAGPAPAIAQGGEADPARLQAAQQAGSTDTTAAATAARGATEASFGVAGIAPTASEELLTATLQAPAPTVGTTAAPQITLPASLLGEVDLAAAPSLKAKLDPAQGEYAAGRLKYTDDAAAARTTADDQIAQQTAATQSEQLAGRAAAEAEVAQNKQLWQAEIDGVRAQFDTQATEASTAQLSQIETERTAGDEKAAAHMAEAEQKAASEKTKAEEQAAAKKSETNKESGGFWGWVKSAAKTLIDGLKAAVNAIYDTLRAAVKLIFEAAKALAKLAIEAARLVIVGLITAYGEIIKGLVKVALAAFPELSKKYTDLIDSAVSKATGAVNKAAELLQTGVSAILDFLAKTIDTLLSLVQDLYTGLLTVAEMLVTGQIGELLAKLENLWAAAKLAPSKFETAAYEELLGGNLDQPLSPAELAMAGHSGAGGAGGASAGTTPQAPWTTENVGVDAVANLTPSPELMAEIEARGAGGPFEFGHSNDPTRSLESMLGQGQGSDTAGASAEAYTDGLTPRERAAIKWTLMKQGISKWWSANWPYVVGGGVVAAAAFIGANILTGGAITAALPPLMSVVGPLFVGVTVAQIGGHLRDYLSKSWSGDVAGGSKSLAKGLAAGAVELAMYATFKVGSAAVKGAKAAGSAIRTGATNLVRGGAKMARAGANFVIRNGKILLKGIANTGIGRAIKKLRGLADDLLAKTRFKSFRIIRRAGKWILQGRINPYIDIATLDVEIDASIKRVTDANSPTWAQKVGESADDWMKRTRKQLDDMLENATDAKAIDELIELEEEMKKRWLRTPKSTKSMSAVDRPQTSLGDLQKLTDDEIKALRKSLADSKGAGRSDIRRQLTAIDDELSKRLFRDEILQAKSVTGNMNTKETLNHIMELKKANPDIKSTTVWVKGQSKADELYRTLDDLTDTSKVVKKAPRGDTRVNGDIDQPFRGPEKHLAGEFGPRETHFNAEVLFDDGRTLNIHIFFE